MISFRFNPPARSKKDRWAFSQQEAVLVAILSGANGRDELRRAARVKDDTALGIAIRRLARSLDTITLREDAGDARREQLVIPRKAAEAYYERCAALASLYAHAAQAAKNALDSGGIIGADISPLPESDD